MRCRDLTAVGLPERLTYQAALDLSQEAFQIEWSFRQDKQFTIRGAGLCSDRLWQPLQLNGLCRFQGYGPFHGVLQLPDISRPFVGLQTLQRFRGDACNVLAGLLGVVTEKVVCEQCYVLERSRRAGMWMLMTAIL